jgi:Ni,Fe-hydrogenase III small subunit
MFEGRGLTPIGTGALTDPPVNIQSYVTNHNVSGGAPQIVVVVAMLASDGHVIDEEVTSSTDESANAAALDHVAKSGISKSKAIDLQQPGTTPRAQEVVYTMRVIPAVPCNTPPGAGAIGGPCAQH